MGAPENSLKWSEQPAFKIWANAGSRHTFFDFPPRVVLHPRRQGPGRGLDEKKILQANSSTRQACEADVDAGRRQDGLRLDLVVGGSVRLRLRYHGRHRRRRP